MNVTHFTPIHESNLVKGETYFCKTKWGEGFVSILAITMQGTEVQIVDGGFTPPLKKYGKGDSMLVPNDTGKFYESKS